MEFANIPNILDIKTRQSASRVIELNLEAGIDVKQKLEYPNQMIISKDTFLVWQTIPQNINDLTFYIAPFSTSQEYFKISSDKFLAKPNKLEIFERQKLFFEENLNNLLTRYKGKYVAIINEKVVDSSRNEMKLIKKIYKKYGYVPVYIKKVSSEKILLRVSSPRMKDD